MFGISNMKKVKANNYRSFLWPIDEYCTATVLIVIPEGLFTFFN